ncbi:sirohydrochlorin chelatase [Salinicoccus roseus]|uniref:sirohydrochlorin chelatase n=1 Tax=Salinicoccus roseus TaxID=45670 RepID=UPI0023015F18|nr:sirohydrochlorin chelatase [Salinicoccus roseus]
MQHIFVVHGMRRGKQNLALKTFVEDMLKDFPLKFEVAFIESVEDSVEDVIERDIQKGIRYFKIQPLLIFSASHYLEDLPNLMDSFKRKYEDITFDYGDVLGTHTNVEHYIEERLKNYEVNDSAIVLVAHGNKRFSDADDELKEVVSKLNHDNVYPMMLYGELNIDKVLPPIAKRHEEIIIVPLFLYDGYLVNKIKKIISNMELNNQITYTEAINFHPILREIVYDRFNHMKKYEVTHV